MLKDLTYQETSDELNKRGYYQEEVYVPVIPETVSLSPTPVTEAVPPTPGPQPVPFLERYGKLVVFGVIGAFLIAIFPGQED
jgi:hypothetical protein